MLVLDRDDISNFLFFLLAFLFFKKKPAENTLRGDINEGQRVGRNCDLVYTKVKMRSYANRGSPL